MMRGNCLAIYSIELSYKIGLMRWRGRITFPNDHFSDSTFSCWVSKLHKSSSGQQLNTMARVLMISRSLFKMNFNVYLPRLLPFQNIGLWEVPLLCYKNTGENLFSKSEGFSKLLYPYLDEENHGRRTWHWDQEKLDLNFGSSLPAGGILGKWHSLRSFPVKGE